MIDLLLRHVVTAGSATRVSVDDGCILDAGAGLDCTARMEVDSHLHPDIALS